MIVFRKRSNPGFCIEDRKNFPPGDAFDRAKKYENNPYLTCTLDIEDFVVEYESFEPESESLTKKLMTRFPTYRPEIITCMTSYIPANQRITETKFPVNKNYIAGFLAFVYERQVIPDSSTKIPLSCKLTLPANLLKLEFLLPHSGQLLSYNGIDLNEDPFRSQENESYYNSVVVLNRLSDKSYDEIFPSFVKTKIVASVDNTGQEPTMNVAVENLDQIGLQQYYVLFLQDRRLSENNELIVRCTWSPKMAPEKTMLFFFGLEQTKIVYNPGTREYIEKKDL